MPQFVDGGVGKTSDLGQDISVTVTIPATLAGEALVVETIEGEEANGSGTLVAVVSVTASGADFGSAPVGAISGAANRVRAECWIAQNVAAGITSVTVTWASTTVAQVRVGRYRDVRAIGRIATLSGQTSDPSISLVTQDRNNLVVAGIGVSYVVTGDLTTVTAGTLRQRGLCAGPGSFVDMVGDLIDNISDLPALVTCGALHTFLAGEEWAAVLVELRENVAVALDTGGAIPFKIGG